MATLHHLTAMIECEEDACIARCPELNIVSHGSTVEEARANLAEAVELFLESASVAEIEQRLTAAPDVQRPSPRDGATIVTELY